MGEMTKVTDVFLEDQEWIKGVNAPFFMWAVGAGCIIGLVGVSWWIYQHNKPQGGQV